MTSPATTRGTSAANDFAKAVGDFLNSVYPERDESISQHTMRSSLEQFVGLCQGPPANYADVRFKIERDPSGKVTLTVLRGDKNLELPTILPFIRGSFKPPCSFEDLQLLDNALYHLKQIALYALHQTSQLQFSEDYSKVESLHRSLRPAYLLQLKKMADPLTILNALDQFRIECQNSPETCGNVKICLKKDANKNPAFIVTREQKEKGLPVKEIFFLIRTVLNNDLSPELHFIIEKALVYLKDRLSNEDERNEYDAISASISTK